MNKNMLTIAGVIGAVALAGAVWFFTQGNAEPTTDVTAPPIANDAATTIATGQQDPDVSTTARSEPNSGASDTFELTTDSSATFKIDEVLRGSPKTVEAVSSVVVGQLRIDRADLANSEIGTILINARDFTSDSSLRDRAIRGPILDTDTFEFVEFVPTAIEGLSGSASVGAELTFTVSGDLTIRDVTQPVVFEVTATLTSDSTIEGTASTVVERGPFELTIPSVPTVANVSEEVPLVLDFVAESV